MTQLACEAFATIEDLGDCVDATDDEKEAALDAATDLLVKLSGGQLRGRCSVTVRPCRESACGCLSCMSCTLDGIPLPGVLPEVSRVKIDGAVVPTSEYTLMNGRWLVRVGTGSTPDPWPSWQYLWKPDTEDRTFSITYEHGFEADAVAVRATVEIATDILKTSVGLPATTISATLDQLTVQTDPTLAASEGFTWTAKFLRSNENVGNAAVWSPELAGNWTFNVFA